MRFWQTMFLAIPAILFCTQPAHARKWTDVTGQFSVEADFVRSQDDVVVLKKANGREITVPWNKLSPADQEYVKSARADSPPAPKPATGDRAELIKALVARGDAGAQESKHFAYQLALRYAPEDVGILEKLPQSTQFAMTEADIQRVQFAISNISTKDLVGWPKATAETDLVELRILLDAKLTGNLQFTALNVGEGSSLLFISKPERKIDEAVSIYGKPTSEKADGGGRVVSYGRVRLVSNSAGQVIMVVMSPE